MSSLDRRIAELERKIEEKEKKKDEFSFGSNEWNLLNDEWKVLNDKWKLLQEEKLKSLAPPPNFTDKELIKNALKEYEEDKEAQIIALSKMSEKQMKFLLASLGKLRRLPSEFIVPTIDIETFEKFTWKTQNEDVDMNDARVHLISQMKKYGVELETTAGAFHLYDVHNDHHIYDLEDPKLGKISGGTGFIIAPKNLLGQSVIYNHCLILELKATKRMKKEDEYKRLVNQTLGELIVASYWSDQKVIAILSDLNEFAHTFQLDYEQDQLVIREISPFPVEYIGFFIKEHLNSSIADNLYKLPAAPSNDMEKVIVEFQKIAVTDPLHSEAYSQFMDLLHLTPKYSYERNLAIRDYLGMSIDIEGIPESKLNSSDNWKNLYT